MAQVMNVGGRQKDDALTTIMKGLQIAQGIYGIKSDMAKVEALAAQKEQNAAEKQRLLDKENLATTRADQGFVTPAQQAVLGKDYDFSRTQTPGAIKLMDDQGALFATIRRKKEADSPKLTKVETVGADGKPVTTFVEPKAGLTIPSVPKEPKKKTFTEGERTAAYHASRAFDTNNLLSQIEESGYNPADVGRAARGVRIPLTDYRPFQNQDDRSYLQAQEEFVASILRKETGAAVTPQEFEKYASIYFPKPGDSQQVIEQKAVARQRAVENLISMAGDAYDPRSSTPFVYKPESASGTALAAPKSTRAPISVPPSNKSLHEMNDDELDAELARLRGGK